ncbi:DEAD/DEAH box helicase [Candidatus Phytoplasma sacchari]|nr:DEAD/DEAH box helicase [Candidatus Phytoplasma sacchari]
MLFESIKRFKIEEAIKIIQKWFVKSKIKIFKHPILYDIYYVKKMIEKIPFILTKNQKKIVNEIYIDFKKKYITRRLIQGDVGTGKTIISFIAALGVISAKKQVLIMAPTEILAKQHYLNFSKLFPEIKTIFLTSKTKNKENFKKKIKEENIQIVFGTHLLSNIDFKELGLIIIDETHKFGIHVKKKTIYKNSTSDVLYLTATPIPKTLNTILFNFLDISILKENPYQKRNIITKIVSFEKIIPLIIQNQQKKEQSYLIVPSIKDNNKYFSIQKIKSLLEKNKIKNFYVLHSRIKTEEKEQIMNCFSNDKKGILLTTSIVEVGIDVKNATLIIILGAEYFGLSQLHQLRGRVGRNKKQNYCFFVSKNKNKRLKILEKENNCFKLSEIDLINRGPGDFLGHKQSGFFKYNFLNIEKDFEIIKNIKEYFSQKNKKERI